MIRLKKGVRLHGIMPEIVFAMVVVDQHYEKNGENLQITSVLDGKHMRASIHYIGGAFDASLPKMSPEATVHRIAHALGPDYDVVLEKDHIHVEWQPKAPY